MDGRKNEWSTYQFASTPDAAKISLWPQKWIPIFSHIFFDIFERALLRRIGDDYEKVNKCICFVSVYYCFVVKAGVIVIFNAPLQYLQSGSFRFAEEISCKLIISIRNKILNQIIKEVGPLFSFYKICFMRILFYCEI